MPWQSIRVGSLGDGNFLTNAKNARFVEHQRAVFDWLACHRVNRAADQRRRISPTEDCVQQDKSNERNEQMICSDLASILICLRSARIAWMSSARSLRVSLAHLAVELDIKVQAAVDPRLLAARESGQRRAAPHDNVCVFARLDRAHAVVDAQVAWPR